MPAEIQRREGRDFSLFRSRHVAGNFAEIRRPEDVPELLKIARERGLETVFLGGGEIKQTGRKPLTIGQKRVRDTDKTF